MAVAFRPIPEGYHALTPYLRVRDAAKAMEFYQAAFGAEETYRIAAPGQASIIHAEMRIGDSVLMLCDEVEEWNCLSPLSAGGTGSSVHLYVRDVDTVVARAVGAGAHVLMLPTDMFWGDRSAKVVDPFGHEWSIATKKEELTPGEMAERAKAAFAGMQS